MGQLARIKTAMRQIGENGFAMKRRLQFYLFSLVMLMLALVLLLLSLLGAFSTSDKQVSELLGAHLSGYASDVASHFQGVAAQGLRLFCSYPLRNCPAISLPKPSPFPVLGKGPCT